MVEKSQILEDPLGAQVRKIQKALDELNEAVGRPIYFWAPKAPCGDGESLAVFTLWRFCVPAMIVPPSPGSLFAIFLYKGPIDKFLRYVESLAREHRRGAVDLET